MNFHQTKCKIHNLFSDFLRLFHGLSYCILQSFQRYFTLLEKRFHGLPLAQSEFTCGAGMVSMWGTCNL